MTVTQLLWAAFAGLAVTGGLIYRRRLRESRPTLTDEMVHGIESAGWVEVEEPLDLEEAREAEDEFWEEEWDEPEVW